MVGKIRGFFFLFLLFVGMGGIVLILAFVDIDLGKLWSSTERWAINTVMSSNDEESQVAVEDRSGDLAAGKILVDAAFDAVKSGKVKAGDIYDLGQFYYNARSDGELDEAEFGKMIDMAGQSGVMDAVIDRFLEPTPSPRNTPPSSAYIEQQMKELMKEVKNAQANGGLGGRNMIALLNRVKSSGLPAQISGMLPLGYDQTKARESLRDMANAATEGRVSDREVNLLFEQFLTAQSDGKLNEAELNGLTAFAERLAK